MTTAEQIKALRSDVAHHKAEIRRHKSQLRWTAAKLARFEDQCRRSGIKIVLTPKGEEGDLHGRAPDQRPH